MAWGRKKPQVLNSVSEWIPSCLLPCLLMRLHCGCWLSRLSLALRRAFHTVLFKHRTQAMLSFAAAPTRAFPRGRAGSTSCSTHFGVPAGLSSLRRNRSNKSNSCSFGRDRDSGNWSRLRRPRSLCQGGVSWEYWELPVAAEKRDL